MWGSGLFVLWFDFCGSWCRRNATERGIFNNLPRQTVLRHMLLKPGHIRLFQRFLWTPTVSLKMESRATVRVNRLPHPNMTGCGMMCKRQFNVITRTALLSYQKADSIDLTSRCVRHIVSITFKSFNCGRAIWRPPLLHPESYFATNQSLYIQRTSWNLYGGGRNSLPPPTHHYIYSGGLLRRNIPTICQPVDK